MLTLPIKKKWFDMILSGEKKEEYRDIKPYYCSRFKERFNQEFQYIKFRNGYSKESRTIQCKVSIKKGVGRVEWGASIGTLYYVITIVDILTLEGVCR